MKKKYIRPESRLYAINLAENIANSDNLSDDSVSGNTVIHFTHATNSGCRDYYTGDQSSPVTQGDNFNLYFNELMGYLGTGHIGIALNGCLGYIG